MPRRRPSKPEPYRYAFSCIAPALPAPFPTADNGVHRYFEDAQVLVLCNHGTSLWSGLGKEDGGYEVLACGENPTGVMAETRRLRAIPRAERNAAKLAKCPVLPTEAMAHAV